MRHCYNCRDKVTGSKIFCPKCLKEQKAGTLRVKGSSNLVIFDKI